MLKLKINTGNAAFDMRDQGAHETARILRLVADELERRSAPCGGNCMDYNGNKVGEWSYDYDGVVLPTEVEYGLDDVQYLNYSDVLEEEICDDLSNRYGYCVRSLNISPKYENYGYAGKLVGWIAEDIEWDIE